MFKFRLQKVLNYRSMLVDAESLRLREIEQQQLLMQNNIINQEILIDRLILQYEEAKTDAGTINSWSFMYGSLTNEKNKIKELRVKEQKLHDEFQKQMLKLVEAQQEKAVLEKLRDNQLADWEAKQRRREQRMMDELASRAHYQLS
ncbi:MAG: hypothetical protein GY893_04455 [bacterium]|nr:hypothetical protein [bacterium]